MLCVQQDALKKSVLKLLITTRYPSQRLFDVQMSFDGKIYICNTSLKSYSRKGSMSGNCYSADTRTMNAMDLFLLYLYCKVMFLMLFYVCRQNKYVAFHLFLVFE